MKHTHWYLRSWEYEEQERPGGVERKLRYKGEYYRVCAAPRRLASVKAACLALTVLLWAVLAVLLTHLSRGAHLFFVGGSCALAIIPAMYLSIGCIRLLLVRPIMTYQDKRASLQRARTASKWTLAFMAVCLGGELFYLAYRTLSGLPVGWSAEAVWLIGAVLGAGSAAVILVLLRLCPVELCPPGLDPS